MVGGNNVFYITTSYSPSSEEKGRLLQWQRQIDIWKAELRAEWDKNHYNYGRRMISKELFHKGIRRHWKVIDCSEDSIREA